MTSTDSDDHLPVKKTYKLYIDGNFLRTESGRYREIDDAEGNFTANICQASRKDLRDAVVAAREAQDEWFHRSPFNRGQILYRMAEMLESRREGMEKELQRMCGVSSSRAQKITSKSIDRLVWYAGWSDKFEQIFGSTNPVASNHFSFTVPEPTGLITIFLPQNSPLLGLVSAIAPVILSGNTVVGIVDNPAPTIAMNFAEVLNNSDLPPGVVNLVTGHRTELLEHVGGHRDVDGIVCYGPTNDQKETLALEGAENVKRVEFQDDYNDWLSVDSQSPYQNILPFVEFKTAWHPINP